ncbi:MAG TPA: hypothetical protein PLM06_01985 [Anaerolineae bacterium]|nr:hypothetical protein [Anaerolineae bacterium]
MAQRFEAGLAGDAAHAEGYFPNKFARILLLSLEEVLGANSLKAVLTAARLPELGEQPLPTNFEPALPFTAVAQLLTAIDELHGAHSGQQLCLRAGRAAFRYGVQDFGGLLSVADVMFRILPLTFRVRLSLEVLAEILNRYAAQQVQLSETAESYFWIMKQCGFCWGWRASYPVCSLMTGLLAETLYWASGGKPFEVAEVTCIALGDPACMFQIGRTPGV